jgi:hypothetical protein
VIYLKERVLDPQQFIHSKATTYSKVLYWNEIPMYNSRCMYSQYLIIQGIAKRLNQVDWLETARDVNKV